MTQETNHVNEQENCLHPYNAVKRHADDANIRVCTNCGAQLPQV